MQQPGIIKYTEYKGTVVDKKTKKPLVFATIVVEESNISTVTNTEGAFSLKIPKEETAKNILISFLGYKSKRIPLAKLQEKNTTIFLNVSVTQLTEIKISAPKDAKKLVRETLSKKGENYFTDPTIMTAFYRETIKKRKKNISLSEAVVNIYKAPYTSTRKDAVQLFKTRKSTDYTKMDTVALKLQGGPFNALYLDIIKYPDYIFDEQSIENYKFTFERATVINNKDIYVIRFKQKEHINTPLYAGTLFIDPVNKVLTSASYALNISNRVQAAKMFVRKKPKNAKVWPTEITYRVTYKEKNNRWYYGYSSVFMEFKINWSKKLFNSVYSMRCEMAVTDWNKNKTNAKPNAKEKIKTSIILSEEAVGFSDPNFWGEYNIIEPEKSIETAIKKIKKQLKRSQNKKKTSSL